MKQSRTPITVLGSCPSVVYREKLKRTPSGVGLPPSSFLTGNDLKRPTHWEVMEPFCFLALRLLNFFSGAIFTPPQHSPLFKSSSSLSLLLIPSAIALLSAFWSPGSYPTVPVTQETHLLCKWSHTLTDQK